VGGCGLDGRYQLNEFIILWALVRFNNDYDNIDGVLIRFECTSGFYYFDESAPTTTVITALRGWKVRPMPPLRF